MRIIHDYYNRNDPSTIYLATPNKDILCALNSIDATSVDFVGKCNDLSTLTFTINRYTENSKGDRIEANGYELVSKYMRLYVTNVGWFIMDTPEIHSTGNIEHKTINASSAEIEFKQSLLIKTPQPDNICISKHDFLTQKALRLIAHKQLIRIVLRDHLIIVFIMVVLGVLGIELRMLVS